MNEKRDRRSKWILEKSPQSERKKMGIFKCPIFKSMKSGFCLDADCRYFYPSKNKNVYCKYSEGAIEKKFRDEADRQQRKMCAELLNKQP